MKAILSPLLFAARRTGASGTIQSERKSGGVKKSRAGLLVDGIGLTMKGLWVIGGTASLTTVLTLVH